MVWFPDESWFRSVLRSSSLVAAPHVQPGADSFQEVHTCRIRVPHGRTFQASDSPSVKWALDDNQSPLKHPDVEIPERIFFKFQQNWIFQLVMLRAPLLEPFCGSQGLM